MPPLGSGRPLRVTELHMRVRPERQGDHHRPIPVRNSETMLLPARTHVEHGNCSDDEAEKGNQYRLKSGPVDVRRVPSQPSLFCARERQRHGEECYGGQCVEHRDWAHAPTPTLGALREAGDHGDGDSPADRPQARDQGARFRLRLGRSPPAARHSALCERPFRIRR